MSDEKNTPKNANITALRFAELQGFGKVNKPAFLKLAGGKTIKKSMGGWKKFCKNKFTIKD